MTKATFISNCGDPFLLLLLFKLFKRDWHNEIDRMYINVNNHCGVPQEVIAELLSQLALDSKVHIIYHPRGIGNGSPITEMTLLSKEDLIVLMEDDNFLFTPGVISRNFQYIESDLVDAVGSPRFSCGNEIAEASKKKYNLNYSGYGDMGCNFWPNMLFVKRKDLLQTDLDFSSHTWKPGEYSKELDHTFKEINHGDTAVWMCVQLRALGVRFKNIPQYHADVYEIQSKEKKVMNWIDGDPSYIHGGSLSAGYGGYLSGRVPDVSNDSAKQEMESRVSWWMLASDVIDGFTDFKKEYKKGIELLIQNANLESGRIQKKINIYKTLMRI